MKRYRINWQISGELVIDVPDDYDDEAMATCVFNALGQAEDDVSERFADEIEDGEDISSDSTPFLNVQRVDR